MNALNSKTLLWAIMMITLFVSSCSTNQMATHDYTKNSSRSASSYKNQNNRSKNNRSSQAKTYTQNRTTTQKSSAKALDKSATNHCVGTKSLKDRSEVSRARAKLVDLALSFQGTPYVYGGKTEGGFDCSGFATYIFKNEGIEIKGNAKTLSSMGRSVMVSKVSKGDLIFFGSNGTVSHVGIVVERKDGRLTVIHSTSTKGVIKQDITDSEYWQKRILFARDIFSTQT